MKNPPALEQLIESLRCLPGVGPKSALRMAYYLLQRDRKGASGLAYALSNALETVGHCQLCNNFSEQPTCSTCASEKREQTQSYDGLYFVLMGRLSPLDGIGPKEINLDKLIKRAQTGAENKSVNEVILATNYTVEGEATAHYIMELLKARNIKVSRIARGLPMGGEIEYVDSGTLAQAIVERKRVN